MRRPALTRESHAILALIALPLLVALSGCGSNDGPSFASPRETAVQAAWRAFEERDYDGAQSLFLAAAGRDARNADARRGLGWSRAYLGDLDAAAEDFEAALSLAPGSVDALAGLAAVELARGRRPQAISRARAALAADPDWVFPHRGDVNAEDLHLILAQAYALSGPGAYDEAQAELDLLDPKNGLDPASPASWIVAGESYATYEEALLAAIESVEARVGAAIP
jgi:tetratricopeptide (TPR) repeat protein